MANELHVKGLMYAVGILSGASGLIHGLILTAGKEFLWWNQATWNLCHAFMPGAAQTVMGSIITGLWTGIGGAVLAGLFGWLYNTAMKW